MKTNITNKAIVTMKSMTKALVLGLTALILAGTAVAQDQVTRPFFAQSHVEVVIDLSTGAWYAMNEGTATHLGHFTGEAEGISQPSIVGEGILNAANGDQVFTCFENPTGGQEGAVQYITGGNGRFENATGEAIQTQHNVFYDFLTNPGFLIITYDEVLVGTITY
ncbi:MAG: hypothetical protein R3F19_23235 [Verrucomicrobiales bacterium]